MKLSIVVVTWNNENFIEQAVRSCLHEASYDYEVIVVDNASDDRTPEIVARVARSSPAPVSYLRNDRNLGPGPARNIGMAAARGGHLMFLDGDDFFSPGAFARVGEVIREADPQLIVFNHARMRDDGSFHRNTMTPHLWERDASAPASRAGLMRNFGVAWNKVYRRDLIDGLGAAFGDNIYEDVSWSFRTQMAAETVYALPDVLVNYRQRGGSITRSGGEQHFDVLKEYGLVLDMLRANPDWLAAYGGPVYKYARDQIFHVGTAPGRVPRGSKERYLRGAVALLKAWRLALRKDSRDLLLAVAERGGYRALDLAMRARRGREYARRRAQALALRKSLDRAVLRASTKSAAALHGVAARVLPMNPRKVMFEAYWGLKADCNPLAICEELSRTTDFDIVWSFKSAAAVPPGFPHRWALRGSHRMMLEAATTKYFVSNTNLPDGIRKRPGSVHLQTWHGTPLKVMGLDIRPKNPEEMDWTHFARRSRRWDYVLSSNPHSSYAWRRAAPYDYKVLETGYPRNDALHGFDAERVAGVRSALGIPPDKKVALYAPTIRDASKGKRAGLSREVFDAGRVAEVLGGDWVLLVRAHYFNQADARACGAVLDVSAYPFSNDICLVSDLLITDYSSMMFDYAVLLRPIVLYVHDYEDYVSTRGVYFDITANPPGPVARTQAELLDVLRSKAFEGEENQGLLRRFKDEFAPWDDGGAARRVIEQVFDLSGAGRR